MIRRYVDVIGTVIVGLATGWLLAEMVTNDSASQSEPAPEVSPEPTPPAVHSVGEASAANYDCVDAPVRSEQMRYAGPEPLPDVYRDMLGIVTETASIPEPYDRYAAFARDVRDEPWAAAMEAGIAIWAAKHAERDNTVFDYVECRSHLCMIAGYWPTGRTAPLDLSRDEGWWQAERIFKIVDGQTDFVLFVERYSDGN